MNIHSRNSMNCEKGDSSTNDRKHTEVYYKNVEMNKKRDMHKYTAEKLSMSSRNESRKGNEYKKGHGHMFSVKKYLKADTCVSRKSAEMQNAQGDKEPSRYIELVKRGRGEKDNEKHNVHNSEEHVNGWVNAEHFYETSGQADKRSPKGKTMKGKKMNGGNHNHVEHYYIMSSTDPVLSSNDSVEDMYEKNYTYFTKNEAILSKMPVVSSESKKCFSSAENINKNNILLQSKCLKREQIEVTTKCYENKMVNSKRRCDKNALIGDSHKRKRKRDAFLCMSNGVNWKNAERHTDEKKNVINFNPLVYIARSNDYHDVGYNRNGAVANYNKSDSHNCRNAPNDRNGESLYDPFGSLPWKNTNLLEKATKEKRDLCHVDKYSQEYENYLRHIFLMGKPYLNEKFKKTVKNNYLSFRRRKAKNCKNGYIYPDSFYFKHVAHRDAIYDMHCYTKVKNVRCGNYTNNIVRHSPQKSGVHYRRKNSTRKNKHICEKNIFEKVLKNLKLLGYALFFCFFISSQKK
ncbi:conserved Plasmodium protein, unknown function [Plasmodium ovale]|uniref:Uncharacterized protein n=2 Tax=Plasmodium ovale TaxID=36330 RepID=A0A1A8WWP6_PLAOA|nr:conserved Plasmodium protein, unknown function [Plasmodium ovale curtisi]SBS97377.1 conserved Plasmodium protein, unknown function [Plasmodium ovale curtisi]SCP06032.1 conserved Plasmodium protein, unknown function [Plasmodium ovale]